MKRLPPLWGVLCALMLPPAAGAAQDAEPAMLESGDWGTLVHPAKDGKGPTVSVMADSFDEVTTKAGIEFKPDITLNCRDGALRMELFLAGVTLIDLREHGMVGVSFPGPMPYAVQMYTKGKDSYMVLRSTEASAFIDRLLGAREVAFNIRVPNDIPAQFRINPVGLGDVIGPLKEACPW